MMMAAVGHSTTVRAGVLALLSVLLGGCALFPREFNLSPLWFHRVDEHGELLEMDCLWPIIHYERTAEGGDDFRIRPLYRRFTEPALKATEHQFLWPFGRARYDDEESAYRLFPLWSWRDHRDEKGDHDVDWYLLFPFIWGGRNDARDENYFAVLPFYADIPQFLTYDRFRTILFPLWVRLDKNGHRHSMVLWPFIGFSSCAVEHSWFHVFPLYAQDVKPGQFERRWLFWPFLGYGRENLDSDDPVTTFWLWPLFGLRQSRDVSGWSFLWPFFEKTSWRDSYYKLNLFWPFFHYYANKLEDDIVQWWVFPLIGHTVSTGQRAWTLLWPLIWLRQYDDPFSQSRQQFLVPLFWHLHFNDYTSGTESDSTDLYPLVHRRTVRNRDNQLIAGEWTMPSLWPYHQGAGAGFAENYGVFWELFAGRRRSATDDSLDVAGRLFTTRSRGDVVQTSVPWLFNYERAPDGSSTLRLLQILPIHFGAAAAETHQ
jgi:hypothetical protein